MYSSKLESSETKPTTKKSGENFIAMSSDNEYEGDEDSGSGSEFEGQISADESKVPNWIPADKFRVSFEGTFSANGQEYPLRMAECLSCGRKFIAMGRASIHRHLTSGPHLRAAEGIVTPTTARTPKRGRPKNSSKATRSIPMPHWIPADVFEFLDFKATQNGKQKILERLVKCKECFREFIAQSRDSIKRHLRSQRHLDALNGSIVGTTVIPQWLPIEKFNVFYEGTFVSNGYRYPQRMAECRTCGGKFPASGRVQVQNHLRTITHRIAGRYSTRTGPFVSRPLDEPEEEENSVDEDDEEPEMIVEPLFMMLKSKKNGNVCSWSHPKFPELFRRLPTNSQQPTEQNGSSPVSAACNIDCKPLGEITNIGSLENENGCSEDRQPAVDESDDDDVMIIEPAPKAASKLVDSEDSDVIIIED